MPFRARIKRAFGRSSSSSGSSVNSKETTGRRDSSVYQPGEPMPRPKYRLPVDKKHKAKLEAFTFDGNVRKNSIDGNSMYSPMGSKMPSRNNSIGHMRAKLARGRSAVGQVVENNDEEEDLTTVGISSGASRGVSRRSSVAYTPDSVAVEDDDEGEEDNVSKNDVIQRQHSDGRPYTDDELAEALRNIRNNDASTL